jgi:predicted branched-subunit amino acid permease
MLRVGVGCFLGWVVFCGSGKYLSFKTKKGFQFFLIAVFCVREAKMWVFECVSVAKAASGAF